MSARKLAGPRRKVVGELQRGKNLVLSLECGHTRLHSQGVTVPKTIYCAECLA